jgi:MFS family permease
LTLSNFLVTENRSIRRELPPAVRPFRHRNYRLLVGSLAFSLFASGMYIVAIAWQVMALGGGPTSLSVVATAFSAGLLLSVLLGGVAADRLALRMLLRAVETSRVTLTVAVGLLAVTGLLELWQLAVTGFLLGATEAFFFPAYTALLPAMLPADELLAANGVEGMLRPIAQLALGPALAGALVGAFTPGVSILLVSAFYLVALVLLLAMDPIEVSQNEERGSVLHDLGEGFGYLFRTGWLFASLAFAILFVLVVVGPFEVLLPFAARATGHQASGYATVLGAFGVGGAIGSLLVANWRLPRRYLTWMMTCWGIGSIPMVVFGLTSRLSPMIAAAFVIGFAHSAAMVIWGTLLQRRVPARLIGRVSSLDFFVSLALMPVSMALAGPVGETIGVPMTFVLAGLIPAPLALAAILGWRLYRDEIRNPLEPTAPDFAVSPRSERPAG